MTTIVESGKITHLGNFWMLKTSDGQSRQFKPYMLLDQNMPLGVGMDVLLTLDGKGIITAIWLPPAEKNDSSKIDRSATIVPNSNASHSQESIWISTTKKVVQRVLTKEMLLMVGARVITELIRSKTGKSDTKHRSSGHSQKALLGEFTDLWGKVVLKLTGSYGEGEEVNMALVINRAFRAGEINSQDKEMLHKIRKLRNAILHPQNEQEHEQAKSRVDVNIINSLRAILDRLNEKSSV